MIRWCAGDGKLKNANLPDDKQFLITKGVPSLKRLAELQKFNLLNEDELEKDAGDGWVETMNPEGKTERVEIALDDDEEKKESEKQAEKPVIDFDDSDDDDDNMFVEAKKDAPAKDEKEAPARIQTKKARKYDLSVTYDFYTQTPRLWLTGYSEEGAPLTQDQIFEDIAAEQAKKTVSMLEHPHTGQKQASIHPCNHAKVMKTIVDTVIQNGGKPEVTQSIFVFLKFISSVVPTIQYDFTVDLELD